MWKGRIENTGSGNENTECEVSLGVRSLWAAHGSEPVYMSCAVKHLCAAGRRQVVLIPTLISVCFLYVSVFFCFLHLPPTPPGFSWTAELVSAGEREGWFPKGIKVSGRATYF